MTTNRPTWPTIAWHAIRPHTLPLSLSPVLAGSVVGWVETGLARLDITLFAALSAAAIQIGTNLQNDAVDSMNGTDTTDRIGPPRVTQSGWLSARSVLRAAHAFFALAVICGAYLVAIGGWPIALLGLVSIAAAYAYSSGPWPISRGPFGEAFVLLFFGLVAVGGVAYLYTGALEPAAWLMGLIVGLPASAVLLINNLRDLEGDRRAGRKTLAIVLGRRGSVRLFGVLLVGVGSSIAALATLGWPWPGALLGLAGLLYALPIWSLLRSDNTADNTAAGTAPSFNQSLKKAARFQFLLTLVVCLGVIVAQTAV
ncbi:MAG: 1,4-dihydroxy-2-naphthoate octaprenyltransferase [Wenzhouxiangellaceae bacterium]|nr:1,4-dihydroxy-2-naphthoate octaprenyltransferase [Wenzhouxiangellaceae bacterium]